MRACGSSSATSTGTAEGPDLLPWVRSPSIPPSSSTGEWLAARQHLADRPDGTFIDFRGKLPLSTVLAVGFRFPEAGGYRFRTEQPTWGETFLWHSDVGPSGRVPRATEREGAPEGRALPRGPSPSRPGSFSVALVPGGVPGRPTSSLMPPRAEVCSWGNASARWGRWWRMSARPRVGTLLR